MGGTGTGTGTVPMKKNLRVSAKKKLRNAIESERQFASQNYEIFVYFTIQKVVFSDRQDVEP